MHIHHLKLDLTNVKKQYVTLAHNLLATNVFRENKWKVKQNFLDQSHFWPAIQQIKFNTQTGMNGKDTVVLCTLN